MSGETKKEGNKNGMAEITILRYDPTNGKKKYHQTYTIPFDPGMSILDALIYIHENVDPSLGFYYSCRMGKCSTCAVKVNGKALLACKTPMEKKVDIEALSYAPLVKDLIVDFRSSKIEYSPELCVGCSLCEKACPMGIWAMREKERGYKAEAVKSAVWCIGCKECENVCAPGAIQIKTLRQKNK